MQSKTAVRASWRVGNERRRSRSAYTGTFTGTSTLNGILVIHADGSANFHDVETFTGTVNGVAGTVTFHLTGHNDADLVVHETRRPAAKGCLAGLHGVFCTRSGRLSFRRAR